MSPPKAQVRRRIEQSRQEVVAIDLFCGVGGLTYGFQAAGIKVAAGFDLDPDCEFPYARNNKVQFVLRDVATLKVADLKHHFASDTFSVLAGCAPCQPFSTYARTRKGDDDRWGLVKHFVRLAHGLQPHVVTMENVPQLARHDVFSQAVSSLRRMGYDVWWSVVDCADYGVPQTRKRLVLLGSRLGSLALIPPRRAEQTTVRETIGDLPRLVAGEIHSTDPLHRACLLTSTNLKRIRSSNPGGTWRDWTPTLRAKCHHKKSGSTFPSVYARMEWNAPGPTITTQYFGFGNGRFGHPQQDRAISLREGAMLQTFPISYVIEPPGSRMSAQRIGRLVGNAVPPALALHIGQAIVTHLASFSG